MMIDNYQIQIQSNISAPPMGWHPPGWVRSFKTEPINWKIIKNQNLNLNLDTDFFFNIGNKLRPSLSTAVSIQFAQQDWGKLNMSIMILVRTIIMMMILVIMMVMIVMLMTALVMSLKENMVFIKLLLMLATFLGLWYFNQLIHHCRKYRWSIVLVKPIILYMFIVYCDDKGGRAKGLVIFTGQN